MTKASHKKYKASPLMFWKGLVIGVSIASQDNGLLGQKDMSIGHNGENGSK